MKFGAQAHFYIYTGAWRDNAAGIKVMHFLCDALNRTGHRAFLVIGNQNRRNVKLNAKLNTPVLDRKLLKLHYVEGIRPIVIYTETILGNPINASCIVRYFLNYPGVLGGETSFPKSEMQVAYSQNIKMEIDLSATVLFLPAVDLDELPKEKIQKEDFHLYYAGKFRAFVGEPELPPELEMIEVRRHGFKKNNRIELLTLLAKAKSIFLFENSTIATEAILLGTPVVFVENPFLSTVIAEVELGLEGTTKGYSDRGIRYATETLGIAQANYLKAQRDFWVQLNSFVTNSHDFFKDHEKFPLTRTWIPRRSFLNYRHKVNLFLGVMRTYGLLKAFRVSLLLSVPLPKKTRKPRFHKKS